MSALAELEAVNFLDAMTFQDLCKLRAVSKDVEGSLCRSPWHWHSAATKALPDFDLNPALFLGSALQRIFQVMPLLLRSSTAQHYLVRSGSPTASKSVVLEERKIAVRHEADGFALAKQVEMQLQLATGHVQRGGHFAKVFIAQMGSCIGEHGSVIVLKDCQQIFSPDVAPNGNGASPTAVNGNGPVAHLYLTFKKGKISMAIRSKGSITKESMTAVRHVLVDLVGIDGSDLLVHCRNVHLRMNGPWTEASGLCLLGPRGPAPHSVSGGMSCILCLRDAKAPADDAFAAMGHTAAMAPVARCVEALQMDNLAAWRRK